jgi:hypothetical protein
MKSTLFVVLDIETTLKKRIAFDVAWTITDRKGNEFGSGSYVIREAFRVDVPFFKEKLGHYFDDTFARQITPASIVEVRDIFNEQINALADAGHRVILTAYNARFDFTWLPHTLQEITGDKNAKFLDRPFDLLDIWSFWGESVPKCYTAEKTASGKFLSTSAESAFRFENQEPDFVERHIAWHDVQIEKQILLKALARKKPMQIVRKPSELPSMVWKNINERLGVPA